MARSSSPLMELFDSLRKDKYKFSKEETEVLTKCNDRMKTYGIQAFLAAGSTAWAVTGSLKLVQRLTATLVGATAGGMFLVKWSVGFCMKDILALEGSPVQERFAAILQKEAVRKPHLRSLLEKYYYLEPLYDDSGQNTMSIVMRKRETAGLCFEKPIREVDYSGEDLGTSQNVNKASTTKKLDEPAPKELEGNATINSSQVHGSGHAHIHDEAFEDPFDMLWQSEPEEESSKLVKGKAVDKRKAKIGVLERRERNRSRYLEMQEKRNTSGWGDAPVEL